MQAQGCGQVPSRAGGRGPGGGQGDCSTHEMMWGLTSEAPKQPGLGQGKKNILAERTVCGKQGTEAGV